MATDASSSGDDVTGGAARSLRADARRNRARVLEAAEAVLSAKGPSAPIDAIARHAGVGVGTVYRHFPTKDALIEAIVVQRFQRLAEEARSLTTAQDAGAAFFRFFTCVVEESAAKVALAEALADDSADLEGATSGFAQELLGLLDTLLTRAQQSGAVRDDLGTSEVLTLLIGASLTASHGGGDPAVQGRALEVLYDGLRARQRPA